MVSWWDRLDENRERRERRHEIAWDDSGIPIETYATNDETIFPLSLGAVLYRQITKGEFVDAIFNCPCEIHELTGDAYMSDALRSLKDEQKFVLYLLAIRLLSCVRVAEIQGQTDRNIRKSRAAIISKLRLKALENIERRIKLGEPLTTTEREFYRQIKKPPLNIGGRQEKTR